MATSFHPGPPTFVSSMIGHKNTVRTISERPLKWTVTESWTMKTQGWVHKLDFESNDYLLSMCYVELYASRKDNEERVFLDEKRVLSTEIKFSINQKKYEERFQIKFEDLSSEERMIWVTLFVYPVLPLVDVPLSPPPGSEAKRRTKIKRSKKIHIPSLKALSRDISSLLNNETFSDVILHCGTEKMHAHRNILCARSSYFRERFLPEDLNDNRPKKDTDDSATEECPNVKFEETLERLDPAIFKDFVNFLYADGKLEISPANDVPKLKQLFIAAYCYGVEDLKVECAKIFRKESVITKDNIDDIRQLFREHGNDTLDEHFEKLAEEFAESEANLNRNDAEE